MCEISYCRRACEKFGKEIYGCPLFIYFVQGAVTSIVSQGINVALGAQQEFSWKAVAVNAFATMTGYLAASALGNVLEANAPALAKVFGEAGAETVSSNAMVITANIIREGVTAAIYGDDYEFNGVAFLSSIAGQYASMQLQGRSGVVAREATTTTENGFLGAIGDAFSGVKNWVDTALTAIGEGIGNGIVNTVGAAGDVFGFDGQFGYQGDEGRSLSFAGLGGAIGTNQADSEQNLYEKIQYFSEPSKHTIKDDVIFNKDLADNVSTSSLQVAYKVENVDQSPIEINTIKIRGTIALDGSGEKTFNNVVDSINALNKKSISDGQVTYLFDVNIEVSSDVSTADCVVDVVYRGNSAASVGLSGEKSPIIIGAANRFTGAMGPREWTGAHEFLHTIGLAHQSNATKALTSYAIGSDGVDHREITFSEAKRIFDAYKK